MRLFFHFASSTINFTTLYRRFAVEKPAPKIPRAAAVKKAKENGDESRGRKSSGGGGRSSRESGGARSSEGGEEAAGEGAEGDGEDNGDSEKQNEVKKLSVNDLFRLLDSNNDGTLMRAEVVAGCEKLNLSEEEAGAMFDEMDTDKSGSLSKDEMADIFGNLGKKWDEKKAKRFLEATSARWDKPAVSSPKLTGAASKASPRYLDKNNFKIKGAPVLEKEEWVPKKEVKITGAAEKATPRYLDTNQYKVRIPRDAVVGVLLSRLEVWCC